MSSADLCKGAVDSRELQAAVVAVWAAPADVRWLMMLWQWLNFAYTLVFPLQVPLQSVYLQLLKLDPLRPPCVHSCLGLCLLTTLRRLGLEAIRPQPL